MEIKTSVVQLCAILFLASGCSSEDETTVRIETSAVTSISQNSAVTGGTIKAGLKEVRSQGVCWSTDPEPTTSDFISIDAANESAFTTTITGLTPSTLYYARAYAVTTTGTVYGESVSFTTLEYQPGVVFDLKIFHIGMEYFSGVVTIEHQEPERADEFGICWSTSPDPTINDNRGTYGNVDGPKLPHSTQFYLKGYARFNNSVVYSEEKSYSTKTPLFPLGNGVTDIDGNHYGSIVVNGKEWMAGELKSKHYANGDEIPEVAGTTEWSQLSTGAWSITPASCQFYHYGVNRADKVLYNWYAVADNRNVCPTGWHVATDEDWSELISSVAPAPYSSLVKENVNGSIIGINDSRFNAVPSGGVRYLTGAYKCTDIWNEITLQWWTASEYDTDKAISGGFLTTRGPYSQGESPKNTGLLVRCVKD